MKIFLSNSEDNRVIEFSYGEIALLHEALIEVVLLDKRRQQKILFEKRDIGALRKLNEYLSKYEAIKAKIRLFCK